MPTSQNQRTEDAVELELVDRLPGADAAQLRRPVGGEDDQRNGRLVGLADRRVVVGGRGAGGAEHRDRRPRRLRRAEREEGRRALVDDHASPRSPAGARARRASGVEREPGESTACRTPAARQLLDEGRGERGVGVGRVHRWRAKLRPIGAKVASQARGGARRAPPRRSRRRGQGRRARCSIRRAARTRPRRSSRRRDAGWRGRGQGRAIAARPPRSSVWATCAAAAIPTGPSSALETIGGQDLGDLDRLLGPADLGELHPGQLAGPHRDRPLGVGAALDALVAGDRDRGRACHLRRLLQRRDRLLGKLDLERLQLGQRALRRLHVPGGVGVDPDPRLGPERLAHRPHLADVVADAELQLEGREAVARPSVRLRRRPRRARRRPASRCTRPARDVASAAQRVSRRPSARAGPAAR